jgi:triosephosphate isomerase
VHKYRKRTIAGNWKMNKTVSEASDLGSALKRDLAEYAEVEIVLCPPFTALKPVCDAISGSQIKLGAQNMHWEPDGAFTGEISARMLRDLYCHYVILGHSERRARFHESDEVVNRKVKAALKANLLPIVCVGETIGEREAGLAEDIVRKQIEGSLAGLGDGIARVLVAYEPVWAIGTGRTATPEIAQEMHAVIRKLLAEVGGAAASEAVRILYGGSMKPDNAAALLAQGDIDGGLIGGASLDARSFAEIVRIAFEA